MIDIKLTEKYRLRNDENCFTLCRNKPKKDNPDNYEPIAYYPSLAALLATLPDRMILRDNESTVENLPDLLAAVAGWHKLISDAVSVSLPKLKTHG